MSIFKSLWWYRLWVAWSAVWMAASVGNMQRGASAPSEWFYPAIAPGHAVAIAINVVLLRRHRVEMK